jgi:hypothetical protein
MRSANSLAASLERVSDKITEIERKLIVLSRQNIRIRVSLDTMLFDAQYASVRARMAALGMFNGAGGVGSPVGTLAMPSGGGRVSDPAFEDEEIRRTRIAGAVARVATPTRVGVGRLDRGPIGVIQVAFNTARNLGAYTKLLSPIIEDFAGGFAKSITRLLRLNAKWTQSISIAISGVVRYAATMAALAGIFGVLGGATIAVTSAIGVLGAVIGSLGAPLAGIVTLITGLVGVIGFAGIPMFKFITDTKRLADEEKQLEERLEGLTKGTTEYNKTLDELNKKRKEIQENGGAYIYSELEKFVKEDLKNAVYTPENKQNMVDILANTLAAVKPLLPLVTDMVRMFTDVMNSLVQSFANFTQSAKGQSFLRELFESALPVVRTMGETIGYLAYWFGQVSIAAAPFIDGMLTRFNNLLDNVTSKWSKPGGMSGMTEFFSQAAPLFEGLMGLVKDFLGGIGRITVALSPFVQRIIPILSDFGGRFVDFIIETTKLYGDDIVRIIQVLAQVLGAGIEILRAGFKAFRPIIMFVVEILDLLGRFFDWFAQTEYFAFLLNPLKVVFESIAWFVDKIVAGLDKIKGAFGFIGNLNPFGKEATPGMIANTQALADAAARKAAGGASGAVVTQPTMALIGEAGPEIVAPLHSARGARKLQYGGGGSGSITINQVHVHGVQNLDQFVAEIKKQVGAAPRISGAGMTIG